MPRSAMRALRRVRVGDMHEHEIRLRGQGFEADAAGRIEDDFPALENAILRKGVKGSSSSDAIAAASALVPRSIVMMLPLIRSAFSGVERM